MGGYQASTSAEEHPAVVKAAPTPSGDPLRIGKITVRAPAAWKTHPMTNRDTGTPGDFPPPDSYYVATGRTDLCDRMLELGGVAPSSDSCPGFFVLGRSFLDRPSAGTRRTWNRS